MERYDAAMPPPVTRTLPVPAAAVSQAAAAPATHVSVKKPPGGWGVGLGGMGWRVWLLRLDAFCVKEQGAGCHFGARLSRARFVIPQYLSVRILGWPRSLKVSVLTGNE